MQKCQKCSTQFSWKNIMKSIWLSFVYKPIKCISCGSKHYINFTTRLILGCAMGVPLLLFINIRGSDSFGHYNLLLYILWIGLIICITPFFARYHLEL